jgi:hypothetical protein
MMPELIKEQVESSGFQLGNLWGESSRLGQARTSVANYRPSVVLFKGESCWNGYHYAPVFSLLLTGDLPVDEQLSALLAHLVRVSDTTPFQPCSGAFLARRLPITPVRPAGPSYIASANRRLA